MNEVPERSYKLRVLKSWISPDPCLIFQCSPQGPQNGLALPKKLHLTLDLRQQSFGLRLQIEKPAGADANHAFIQILRKQCPNFTLKAIAQDSSTGDLWLPLLAGPDSIQPWLIRLVNSKPPLASLMAPDGTIYVSFGQKGTFTKKHDAEHRLPASGCQDILTQLFDEFLGGSRDDTIKLAADADLATELISKAQRQLIDRLKRKLKTSRKTLEKLQSGLPSAQQVLEYEQAAIHLQSYAWMIKPETFSLRLEQAMTGLSFDLELALNPELSPGQNIEKYFLQFHKAKRGRELGLKQWRQAEEHCQNLTSDLVLLNAGQTSELELKQLTRKYHLPELSKVSPQGPAEGSSKPFKTYQASTGHKILVGKSAQDNDLLTKAARSNDFWLHAVGVTGSHVIVPVTPDIRSALPTQLLREAAMLALYFSKLREDQAGECYIARKAHLKKQRGMPAGLWRIDKSESLFFRYETEELQSLLQTIQV